MQLFLAGENGKKRIIEEVQLFLAGGEGRHFVLHQTINPKERDDMKVFLAGVAPRRDTGLYESTDRLMKPYILESFFYANDETERLLPLLGDFLLDSGAFTFMQGNSKANFDEYVERYADFINRNDVQKFFELDIDAVVGYKNVLTLRKKLEKLTNKQPIPVWHLSRGKEEFLKMCDEYSYVAIGGIVTKEIKPQNYSAFTWLIKEAHKRSAKIHGLGFTSLEGIKKYHFDSVDSTAWTTGNRFGYIYYFDGKTMKKKDAPKNHRIGDSRKAALINYIEWIKFQKYAEKHL